MSGNPFRKQQPAEEGNKVGNEQKKKKVKKVQFVSPISSPQEPPDHHPRFPSLEELDNAPKSPPPKGADEFESIDTKALLRGDLTAGGTIDLDNSARREDVSSAPALSVPKLSQPPPGRRGPPANPFARTLATTEQDATKKEVMEPVRKPAMDVDAFKRLLLTGKADAPAEGLRQENGNSTDVSSGSRQSLSDSGKETTAESPPSSPEDASTEDESSDSETGSNEETVDEQVAAAVPNIPKVPQTVSFDDFDASLQGEGLATQASTDVAPSLSPEAREDVEVDVNKALPEAPATTTAAGKKAPLTQPEHAQGTKKAGLTPPPPPPTSRRGVKIGNRSRSGSNVDQSTPPREIGDVQVPSKPKPPPPRAPPPRVSSRETKRLSDLQDHTNSSSDSVPTLSTTDTSEVPTSTKLRPPPPPSRAHKGSQQTLKRTPSSSSSIVSAPRRTTPTTGGSGAPPPPPRPRRGDKRSSFDGSASATGEGADTRRSSGMSFDRRDSVSSLQRVAEDEAAQIAKAEAEAKATQDMLADLDAFQREVDALRAKALAGK
ncbi:hypothetical protein CAC42_3865 [Sphaceloma murrayae]|uniref:Uncharacterized protein n=1 Tax=Sphaceloma murrayae TaxID=2082308 RepID=A0A2K1QS40_9PEZI|nr:hypothetical protein CAC42_3865 [Sphaceloma murrayae]